MTRRRMLLRPGRQQGFSLIELGLALIISGLIGLLVLRWIASAEVPGDRAAMQRQLNEAQAAIEGFALANSRLPCPASDTGGTEACSSATAVYLPWRTLGVDSGLGRLHYGVNRSGGFDLASAPPATAKPDFGIDYDGAPTMLVPDADAPAAKVAHDRVVGLKTTTVARRTVVNGLDWCKRLRQFSTTPSASGVLTAGNISATLPVATILVHPGANGEFDGNNVVGTSATYDLPGRNQDQTYDDLSLATGPADLGARLGCTGLLSAMQTAGQGAFAQYDNARLWEVYWQLRVDDVDSAESEVTSSEAAVAMAAANLAITTAAQVVAIASAANTEGLTAAGLIAAAANLALAITDTINAATALSDAQEALQDSKDALTAANAYAAKIYNDFADALELAIVLDQKGLNP